MTEISCLVKKNVVKYRIINECTLWNSQETVKQIMLSWFTIITENIWINFLPNFKFHNSSTRFLTVKYPSMSVLVSVIGVYYFTFGFWINGNLEYTSIHLIQFKIQLLMRPTLKVLKRVNHHLHSLQKLLIKLETLRDHFWCGIWKFDTLLSIYSWYYAYSSLFKLIILLGCIPLDYTGISSYHKCTNIENISIQQSWKTNYL